MAEAEKKKNIKALAFKTAQGIKNGLLGQLAFELLTGFVMARAVIFNDYAPFGVALMCVAPIEERLGLAYLLGVCIGYVTMGVSAVPYFVCSACLYFLRLLLRRGGYPFNGGIFIGICAFAFLAVSQFIVMSSSPIDGFDAALLITTSSIAPLSSYFISRAIILLNSKTDPAAVYSQKDRLCILLFAALIIIFLSPFEFFGASLARTAAALFVLIAADMGKMYDGTVAGIISGAALALSHGGGAVTVAGFCIGGFLAGIFSESGKALTAGAVVLAGGAMAFFGGGGSDIIVLIETVFAGTVYIFLPMEKVRKKLRKYFSRDELTDTMQLKDIIVGRIRSVSQGFRKMSEIVTDTRQEPVRVIESAVSEIEEVHCARCKRRLLCYGGEYNDTIETLWAICRSLMQKGKTDDAADLRMKKKCEKYFAVTEDLREAFTSEGESSREEYLSQHYREISSLLTEMAEDFEEEGRSDSLLTEKVSSYIKALGGRDIIFSCRDNRGKRRITVRGNGFPRFPETGTLTKELSALVGFGLEMVSLRENDEGWTLEGFEAERFSVRISGAVIGKDGHPVSGDSQCHFHTDNGKYLMAISDGMGSGEAAKKDSQLAVSTLEALFKSGIPKESAVNIINSALVVRNDENSFATIDLAVIDLFTGRTEFLKAGAAPTYIKRNTAVFEISNSTLPVGLMAAAEFELSDFTLRDGDFVIMVSDGVVDDFPDIKTRIAAFDSEDTAGIAAALLGGRGRDDKSVLVLRISEKN